MVFDPIGLIIHDITLHKIVAVLLEDIHTPEESKMARISGKSCMSREPSTKVWCSELTYPQYQLKHMA